MIALLLALLPLTADATTVVRGRPSSGGDDYTAPRNATVSAAGAALVRVEARAGELKIVGRAGITEVRVRGTARASRESDLPDIKLTAERRGDEVVVLVDIPTNDWSFSFDNRNRALDLEIEVPLGSAMNVKDSSGDLEIRDVGALDLQDSSGAIIVEHVKGDLRIRDSSGDIRVDGVTGDAWFSDSSGGIEVHNVTGSATVANDSSGDIDMEKIGGSVHIIHDSSGGIDVTDVAGDFIVEHKSSGGVEHHAVKGRVELPRRWSGRSGE